MKTPSLRLSLCLGLLASCGIPLSQAQRRDFAATYRLTHIVESGDQVSATITLKLFNHSGSEIHDATVALFDSSTSIFPERQPIDSFHAVASIPAYKETTLRHRFTVPAREYSAWKEGRDPELVFQKQDGEGNAENFHIDLRRDISARETAENGTEVSK